MADLEVKPVALTDSGSGAIPLGVSGYESDKLKVPDGRRKEDLTVEAIQAAAVLHFERTGKWPAQNTKGEVPGMPGETWQAIDLAGQNGHRGLVKGQTLAKILKPLKEEYGSKIYGRPLTVEAIQAASVIYFEKKGKWPNQHTEDEVPGMPGEKWGNINNAGRTGYRGLIKGQTLAEILKPLREQYGSKIRGAPLTVEAIREAAIKHFQKAGEWPNQHTKNEVPGMPGETWQAINLAGQNGHRGLVKGQTLSEILQPLKKEYESKIYGRPLTVEAIQAASVLYFKKTGRWPTKRTTDEVPGMPGETWGNIYDAGRKGHRGLEKGQTLSEILKPLKDRLSINLGGTRLPHCFINPEKEATLSARRNTRIGDKNLGALFKAIQSVTFSKGEAFEQLVGLLLLSANEEQKVIPQYCLVVDSDRSYYGIRADYRVGKTIYEVKWGGATDNIEETHQKPKEYLPDGFDYKLILLNKNKDVTAPYSLFNHLAKDSLLGDWLLEVGSYIEELVAEEKASEMTQLRDYLYGLVMKGNTLSGKERQNFLAEELTGFLDSENKQSYAQAHRYAIYCPLSAHFEYKGKLYSATITPKALQTEKPEQYQALYTFGRLVFEDPLDRDIAVMCELSGETGGLSAESVLREESGIVENPVFHLPGVGAVTKAEIPDLDSLKNYLTFVEDNFEFGLEYIEHFGNRA